MFLLKILIEALLLSWPNDQRKVPGDGGNHERSDDDRADGDDSQDDEIPLWSTDLEEMTDRLSETLPQASLLRIHCKSTTAQEQIKSTNECKNANG